jgi:adenylosuccinate synthase
VARTTAIVGAQWGDEGKGKITDVLAGDADVVARFQGGNNAGHTVVVGDTEHALHLVPSGVLRPGVTGVLGNGTVVDPEALADEVDRLADAGALRGELLVGRNAHVVFPHQRELDAASEEGDDAIGTTKRGIGPTYASKASRFGARLGTLVDPDTRADALDRALAGLERWCRAHEVDAPDRKQVEAWVEGWRDRVAPHVGNATQRLLDAVDEGQRVLLEGAQGTLLDLDHGNYPYVTSSNPTSGGAAVGTGLPPTAIDEVLGIAKAYTTRVGKGPFPTELEGPAGDHLAEKGDEFGTTTGRRRRVGWLDLVALRWAARINGFTQLALIKLDVLEGLEEVKVCTAYELDGELERTMPRSTHDLARATPRYETVQGSFEGAEAARELDELPAGARALVEGVEDATGCPVRYVSNGPERSALMTR